MLAAKSLRLLPASNYVFVKNGTGSMLQSQQMISLGIKVEQNHNPSDFIINAPMTPYTISAVRFYSAADAGPQQSQQAEVKSAVKAVPPPPPPSPQTTTAVKAQPPLLGDKSAAAQLLSQLPDKKQVEKYFFRTVAFIWDTSHWAYRFLKQNVDEHIVKNKSVQDNYKKFLDKMEKSKKD